MRPRRKKPDPAKRAAILAEARRLREQRESGYRERALALFPHVCARCGREFSGAGLRELTVHHKDHNHQNNPPDGSNWELLCLYCHDNEHQDLVADGASGGVSRELHDAGALDFRPFEGLKGLLGDEEGKGE